MVVISSHQSHSDAFAAADRLTLATGRIHRARLGIECWQVVELSTDEALGARYQWLVREVELLQQSAARYEQMAADTTVTRRAPFLGLAAQRRAAAQRLRTEANAISDSCRLTGKVA